jgi:hypothetical protein
MQICTYRKRSNVSSFQRFSTQASTWISRFCTHHNSTNCLLQTVYMFSLLTWIPPPPPEIIPHFITEHQHNILGASARKHMYKADAISLSCVRNNKHLPVSFSTRPLLTIKKPFWGEYVRPWHSISHQPLSGFSWNSAQWPFNEQLSHIREIQEHRPSGRESSVT